MSVKDPGPPTWNEALSAHQVERAKAGDWVRRLKESIGRLAAGDAAGRAAATGLLVKAEAEWKHWNAAHQRAVAFIRVHPAMGGENIYAKCGHEDGGRYPHCFTGAEEGWYGLPVAAEPVTSFYEREPGDGTEDEEAVT